MEQKGIEPLTSSLRTKEPELEPEQKQELTGDAADAYTQAYIESPDSVHIDPPGDDFTPAGDGSAAPGDDFAAALMAIQGLPLSDEEKAEAVRRLMVQGESK